MRLDRLGNVARLTECPEITFCLNCRYTGRQWESVFTEHHVFPYSRSIHFVKRERRW